MSQNDKVISKNELGGSIVYSDDVIATIAGLAIGEVDGVVGTSGGIKSGIVEMFGKKDLSKGIKAVINDNRATIDINAVLVYGTVLNNVATELQSAVKRAVEGMTGLEVEAVNVNIISVQIPVEEKKED